MTLNPDNDMGNETKEQLTNIKSKQIGLAHVADPVYKTQKQKKESIK